MKINAGNGRSMRLSTSNVFSGKHIHTQHDASFLFSLGISFGIITSMLANKREMDKLRELLKQTENFVEDLQEELEMKDSMRVKELLNENYGSEGTYDDHSFCDKELNGFSPEKHMDNSPITDCKKSYGQKEEESSEAMSKIEAELEAELERLGLNMDESNPERPQSELVELFPFFSADYAQGELQTNVIGGKEFFRSELNEENSATVVPVNYAVSPHELTLRLHEVIQSRLEGRVQELEIALENSQRKLWFVESEHQNHSQKCFPRKASSFSEENVLGCNDCEPMTETLVMNLSDDPAGAYSDSYYEEIIKIDDFEENSPSSNYESNDVTGDENCECDYEMERRLIRQIVERTKKGSPIFQNARRILYSMDKDEH